MISDIRLRSEAFLAGGVIPRRHTGDGEDISPSIRWDEIPERVAELALIVDDPDSPTPEPWVHWVIYKILADEPGLAEGMPSSLKLEEPPGALQGKNSWNTVGYRGPLPPAGSGKHRYRFTLYMLDDELSLSPGIDKNALLRAMDGHIIGKSEIVGVYSR